MFPYLRLRWEIWRLEHRRNTEEKGTHKAVETARARSVPPAEIEEITGGSSEGVLQRKIHEAHSRYLVSEARRLVIPAPDWNDNELWSINSDTGDHVLSVAGINKLRADIRAEKKARAERFLMWVPGIVGILGALIGLVSVWKGK